MRCKSVDCVNKTRERKRRVDYMQYSNYVKRRALFFRSSGASASSVALSLQAEGLHATHQGLAKFFRRYELTGTTRRQPGSGRATKLTPEVLYIFEEQMELDGETTAVQLEALLASHHHPLSISTVIRCRIGSWDGHFVESRTVNLFATRTRRKD